MNDLDSELLARLRRVLARAVVISDAESASVIVATESQPPASRPPTGDNLSLADRIVQAAGRCVTDAQLRQCVYIAEAQVADVKFAAKHHRDADDKPETEGERVNRILAHYEGLPPDEVAVWERCNVQHIVRLRAHNGRNPNTGREDFALRVAGHWSTREQRIERVRQLRSLDPSLSQRDLAKLVGVSHPTIAKDLEAIGGRVAA